MRRRPTPLQRPGCTKKKGAHADRSCILCAPTLSANEINRLDIGEGFPDARATGQANEVDLSAGPVEERAKIGAAAGQLLRLVATEQPDRLAERLPLSHPRFEEGEPRG